MRLIHLKGNGDFDINSYICLVSEHAVDCGILSFSWPNLLEVHVKPTFILMKHQVTYKVL